MVTTPDITHLRDAAPAGVRETVFVTGLLLDEEGS